MAKIELSSINPNTHFRYNGLEYKKGSWEVFYTDKTLIKNDVDIDINNVKIGIRSIYKNTVLQSPIPISSWKNGANQVFSSLDGFLLEALPLISFSQDTKIGLTQKVNTFGDLVSGALEGDLAYVEEEQGTKWLLGSLGGTYYPSGWYIWDGMEWVSDRGAIAQQFADNVLQLSTLSNISEKGWGYYATNIKYTDLTGEIPTGKILVGNIGSMVLYRFISTAQTGLYPSEDSFYSTFDGTSLTGLITTR